MEILIDNMFPTDNIENLEKAPPEIKSINPDKLFEPVFASSLNATVSIPGTDMKHPNLNITISNSVYINLFLTSGVFKAFLIVLNN